MEKKILTDEQIAFLRFIGVRPAFADQFYLTGGTPLAAFYLNHRYSEDLDFFSEQPVDMLTVRTFWEDAKTPLGITAIETQQSYNRNLAFLTTKNGIMKTEFTYFPFPRIEPGEPRYGIAVDSALDIAVNKLFTIYQRTAARDYIDLYMLCRARQYAIPQLLMQAKAKFDWHIDPIQLGAQFLKATEAEDLPRMITPIDADVWQEFFVTEADRLRDDIFENEVTALS